MKIRHIMATAAIAVAALGIVACEETTTLGSSLIDDNIRIDIDSSFTVTGSTVATGPLRSRTVNQLLGSIDIPEYGRLSSSVVTQFISSTELDTAEFNSSNIDSLLLIMRYDRNAFIGDSVAPMGLTVYPLTKQLPSPIYSDFDPEGYYDPTPIATKIYNTSTLDSDSLASLSYGYIRIKLPLELGKYLFDAFVNNPELYAGPETFTKSVFPGLYIANSYGSGRITNVSQTSIRMHMHAITYDEDTQENDTIYGAHDYFLVTPEVLSNNNLNLAIAPSVVNMVDNGENILLAPGGYEIELKFPTNEIVDAFHNAKGDLNVVNSLTFNLPVEEIANDFDITVPPYVLLVQKSKRDQFFANNELPDNITSFYATYDSSTGSYSFSNMRQYILKMIEQDVISDDDQTFVLCPVNVTFEQTTSSSSYYYSTTQTTESAVNPYIGNPTMGKIQLDNAKIKFTYSSQKAF